MMVATETGNNLLIIRSIVGIINNFSNLKPTGRGPTVPNFVKGLMGNNNSLLIRFFQIFP